MARVHFTAWLRELVPDGPVQANGGTVGEALATLFTEVPQLRGYLVDERGNLRRHVCVFADGQRLACDATMGHPVRPDSELYVMQALSGG
jgi:molybdopterin converting factor small subunit